MNMLTVLKKMSTGGHERTVRLKKNIVGTFAVKGGSVLINLLLVPLTIHYLTPTCYGIWLTLSSIVSWSSMFDIGLGHGLRNRFAEAMAKGDRELAKSYVSTTYALLACILTPLVIAFICVNPFLNWSRILNTPEEMRGELGILALIVFCSFCAQLLLQLISTVLTADQKSAKASLIGFLGNVAALIAITILIYGTSGSLLLLGVVVGLAPVLVLAGFSGWLYRHEYRAFAPSWKAVNFSHGKSLAGLGVSFFLIQISGVVVYSTSNILVAQFGNPSDVTLYNIAYRYFTSLVLVFTIILTPVWTAVTEAYHKNDNEWIQTVMKKLVYIWIAFAGASVLMLLLSKLAYRIWVGSAISVPLELSIWLAVFVVWYCWDMIFVFFLNGIGKVRMQLYAGLAGAALFIPLSMLFARYFGMGFIGVAAGSVVLAVANGIWMPIQYLKIIRKKSRGVWDQ